MNLIKYNITIGGRSSVVEHFVANERVVGSNPIARSSNTMKEQKWKQKIKQTKY